MNRRAKIVATIGPASRDEETLRGLIRAGMNVARVNFSHGSNEDHAILIDRIRRISKQLAQPITILQDLQGPKIRTGNLAEGQVELKPGHILTLTTDKVPGDDEAISVDYKDLPKNVEPGEKILLDDGKLELKVIFVGSKAVETEVVLGGTLKPHKGINLPGVDTSLQAFTEKDKTDLQFGLEQGVDAIALSFVRSAKDIHRLRETIADLAPGAGTHSSSPSWSWLKRWITYSRSSRLQTESWWRAAT